MRSEFATNVYDAVKAIPKGCVASYGQIAAIAGRPKAARIVGHLLHNNPEPGAIPCHRVVFKDGSVCEGFAFGGAGVQRALLEGEGVVFTSEGKVDMELCRLGI